MPSVSHPELLFQRIMQSAASTLIHYSSTGNVCSFFPLLYRDWHSCCVLFLSLLPIRADSIRSPFLVVGCASRFRHRLIALVTISVITLPLPCWDASRVITLRQNKALLWYLFQSSVKDGPESVLEPIQKFVRETKCRLVPHTSDCNSLARHESLDPLRVRLTILWKRRHGCSHV